MVCQSDACLFCFVLLLGADMADVLSFHLSASCPLEVTGVENWKLIEHIVLRFTRSIGGGRHC